MTQRSVPHRALALLAASAAVVALALAGCAPGQAAPAVPSLGGGTAGAPSQASALHLAGQCMRQHGIPGFPDPVLNSVGQVTFSKSQLVTVSKAVVSQALTACRVALDRAGIQAGRGHDLGGKPSPAQLREIVAFARCMRAHGLTGLQDPNPANGQISLPPGVAKDSPVVLRASRACRSLLPGNGS
jgi:hypothetical protein